MADIILTTLNAKYIHAAFGLRYLLANLGDLQPRARLAEFDIHQRPLDVAELLLACDPKIVGLGVYIWNVTETTELVGLLKRLQPDLVVVLGGPEVSYETGQQPIVHLADYVITGEADLQFGEVCRQVLSGQRPAEKVIPAPAPDFCQLVLPYDFYTDADIAHRVIYVEASRGCPFACEFCLSALDVPVRQAPLPEFLDHMQRLLARGVRQFKFVDRTFNLNPAASQAILEFCLAHYEPGRFFHFEMIPDRLPETLRKIVRQFPPGALQFEVGVQSFNAEICQRISRRQDVRKLAENFHFLRTQTGVHIHADLIFGLPGESLGSMAAGFDRLVALGPQEIQVGILKRLRGTPIARHDAEWEMVYSPQPPYEILQHKLIDFRTMQRLRRFARYWDLVANSGNFAESVSLLWNSLGQATRPPIGPPSACSDTGTVITTLPSDVCETDETLGRPCDASPFAAFLHFSDWLYVQVGRTDSIALQRLAGLLFRYLTRELGHDPHATAEILWRDYQRGSRTDKPEFLRPFLADARSVPIPSPVSRGTKRQARHLGA